MSDLEEAAKAIVYVAEKYPGYALMQMNDHLAAEFAGEAILALSRTKLSDEVVEAAARAYLKAESIDPDIKGGKMDLPAWKLYAPEIRAALSAALAKMAEG